MLGRDGGEVVDDFPSPADQSVGRLAEWIDLLPNDHETALAARPDVMVLAARYGDGHLRAAKAIGMDIVLQNPKVKLAILDYYKFVNPRLDNTLRWLYMMSVRFVPAGWRWFYRSTQKISPDSRAQHYLNSIGMDHFYEAIRSDPPQVIISTYPTAAGVVSTLKRKGCLDVLNYVVMTDYSVHSQWIHPGVDGYFVGGDDMRDELLARGVEADRVVVSGIPVDERFRQPVDAAAVRHGLGIGEGPVLLFMGGSYMPLREYGNVLEAMDQVPHPHTTIVVAGREENRRALAETYRRQAKHPMVVMGYVDNVHELMAIANLLVSKAGGLTTTEALCRGLPMVIYRPIPGQEDANADYLVRHGAGRRAKSQQDVTDEIDRLLGDPWELWAMAREARQLGHPDAALVIAQAVGQALDRRQTHAPA
ncbi:MAG: glycosyltransferase [Thermaerobacter sp.]|nr:glycosyltransferase [Thermaerobacter sp.]